MLDAREIKSRDEIALLSTAAAMVDGTYAGIADALRPGVRENEIVALASKRLYEMGSDDVESVNTSLASWLLEHHLTYGLSALPDQEILRRPGPDQPHRPVHDHGLEQEPA